MSLPDRFAVIADIHGNADALRAVLRDIDAQEIGTVLHLGDVFSGPLAAAETWDLLRSRAFPTVRGNHDRHLIEQRRDEMMPSDRTAFDDLPPEALGWLRGLPMVLELGEAFLCHATPGDDQIYWLEDVNTQGQVLSAPRATVSARLGGVTQTLILCAHTHLPRIVRLGAQLIVNPGSVGCPAYDDLHPVPHVVQTGTPDACYAVLTRAGTTWQVTHRHVPYDSTHMVALARARGREDWATALATGWLGG
ncbi:metallophosphatase family protein [Salipiger sp. P9]|uniref:metallophosphoesterase family protein n=1 Tax=Salipiger pentaromativorans TaxID=2943193 RepID=UPI0021585EB8|nr:metallophosphoesterase family protein [Salipiger pentaromativorans]MCR8550723.1 metallophosphatase family protein [Salipiger pentaromativorans]